MKCSSSRISQSRVNKDGMNNIFWRNQLTFNCCFLLLSNKIIIKYCTYSVSSPFVVRMWLRGSAGVSLLWDLWFNSHPPPFLCQSDLEQNAERSLVPPVG